MTVTIRADARVVPTADEFESWALHPVTQFVAAAFHISAAAQRDAWMELSWGLGKPDPIELAVLRARADAYSAFLETGLERYVELNTEDR